MKKKCTEVRFRGGGPLDGAPVPIRLFGCAEVFLAALALRHGIKHDGDILAEMATAVEPEGPCHVYLNHAYVGRME